MAETAAAGAEAAALRQRRPSTSTGAGASAGSGFTLIPRELASTDAFAATADGESVEVPAEAVLRQLEAQRQLMLRRAARPVSRARRWRRAARKRAAVLFSHHYGVAHVLYFALAALVGAALLCAVDATPFRDALFAGVGCITATGLTRFDLAHKNAATRAVCLVLAMLGGTVADSVFLLAVCRLLWRKPPLVVDLKHEGSVNTLCATVPVGVDGAGAGGGSDGNHGQGTSTSTTTTTTTTATNGTSGTSKKDDQKDKDTDKNKSNEDGNGDANDDSEVHVVYSASQSVDLGAVGRQQARPALAERRVQQFRALLTHRKERRAMTVLLCIALAYFVVVQLAGFLVLGTYFACSARARAALAARGVRPWAAGLFFAVSCVSNAGLSLFADSAVPLTTHPFALAAMAALIVAGNTGYPIVLRAVVAAVGAAARRGRAWRHTVRARAIADDCAYILKYPRRLTTSLLPRATTLWLLVVLAAMTVAQLAMMLLSDWDALNHLAPVHRVFAALFQVVCTRTAGFSALDYNLLAQSTVTLTLIMMYISSVPNIVSMRSSREKRAAEDNTTSGGDGDTAAASSSSSSFFSKLFRRRASSSSSSSSSAPSEKTDGNDADLTVSFQIRRVLVSDTLKIFLGFYLICLVEDHTFRTNPRFDPFVVLFEVVACYGTVGASYTGTMTLLTTDSTLTLLLVMAVMMLGRHRGLPDDIDQAVLPGVLPLRMPRRRVARLRRTPASSAAGAQLAQRAPSTTNSSSGTSTSTTAAPADEGRRSSISAFFSSVRRSFQIDRGGARAAARGDERSSVELGAPRPSLHADRAPRPSFVVERMPPPTRPHAQSVADAAAPRRTTSHEYTVEYCRDPARPPAAAGRAPAPAPAPAPDSPRPGRAHRSHRRAPHRASPDAAPADSEPPD